MLLIAVDSVSSEAMRGGCGAVSSDNTVCQSDITICWRPIQDAVSVNT